MAEEDLVFALLPDGRWARFKRVFNDRQPYQFVRNCKQQEESQIGTIAFAAGVDWRSVATDVGRVALAETATPYFPKRT